MKKDKIVINDWILRAVRNELWCMNLHEVAREKRISLDRVARECNLFQNEICPEKSSLIPRFKFMPRDPLRPVNKLKQFMDGPYCGNFFGSNTLENIAAKMEIWRVHPQWGPMAGQPDTDRIFPGYRNTPEGQKVVIKIALEKGWLVQDKQGIYLTDKAIKLPKVKHSLSFKNAGAGYDNGRYLDAQGE